MKILFVLYGDFKGNSAIQVHNFANALVKRGNECVIAVPCGKGTLSTHIGDRPRYLPLEFPEALKSLPFSKPGGPDIIHAWTPREVIRKQCQKLCQKYPGSRLLIHLEDNEEFLLEAYTQRPFADLYPLTDPQLRRQHWTEFLAHPRHYQTFLKEADGFTVIMDRLLDFLPGKKPHLNLWPIIDPHKFGPLKKNPLKKNLKLKPDDFIIGYMGNAHAANAREMRSLYLSVALANREGIPVKLIRAGENYYPFLGDDLALTAAYTIELGFTPWNQIAAILDLADMLIQPGKADRFNEYRLPAKLPEFLAAGKPVALPCTNLGRFLRNGEEAIVMAKGDAEGIIAAIQKVRGDKVLRQKVSSGARAFACDHFNEEKIGAKLSGFYTAICRGLSPARTVTEFSGGEE